MGQPVAVIEKPSTIPGVIRFELNRSLTGQGHELFASPADAVGHSTTAELGRRLFASGQVESVHAFSNVVTVKLLRGFTGAGLDDVVRNLYQYWKPGMEPPPFAEPEPEVGGGDAAHAATDGGGAAPLSDYERRIPQILVDRSRAALAKWRAAHG